MKEVHTVKNISIGNFIGVFNLNNGHYMIFDKKDFENKDYVESIMMKYEFYKEDKYKYDKNDLRIIKIVINISKKCNLACEYCFIHNSKDTDKQITFEEVKEFIDMIMNEFPLAEHFHIDLTGDGEPLLRFDLIKEIIEYTDSISRENKLVKVGFCTNGTLLNREIIDYLQEKDIYYGISVDGTRKINDYYRKSADDKSVHKRIIKNIKHIDSKYIGAATTISNHNTDLVANLKHLNKYFDVISMKPVRETNPKLGAITQDNVHLLMTSYDKLHDFLLKETLKMNTWYLVKIIKDADLFGRFLKRVFINQFVITRCDAGISRFALDNDKNIYVCGAASKNTKYNIGSLNEGLNIKRMENLFKFQTKREYCHNCWAQHICGGICMIYYEQLKRDQKLDDRGLCLLNKHLIKLAINFKETIFLNHQNMYKKIVGLCSDNHFN